MAPGVKYVGRNDFANLFQRFVELAELKINRQIRVAEMESSAAVTVTDGVGPLPEDFLEARSVQTGSGLSFTLIPFRRSNSLCAVAGRCLLRLLFRDGI